MMSDDERGELKAMMVPALRQYRHNCGDSFVFGYDINETLRIVDNLNTRPAPTADGGGDSKDGGGK